MDSESMSGSRLMRGSLLLTSEGNGGGSLLQSANRNEQLSKAGKGESALRSRGRPSRRVLFIGVAAVIIVVLLLALIYTLPVSSVRIEALIGPSYGSVQLTISLDGVVKTHTNISWTTGVFSSLYTVAPGKHTVHVHWDRAMDGITDETKTFVVGPFSGVDVRFSHGAGWG